MPSKLAHNNIKLEITHYYYERTLRHYIKKDFRTSKASETNTLPWKKYAANWDYISGDLKMMQGQYLKKNVWQTWPNSN